MPRVSTFTAIVASTAAAGLAGAVYAGAADSDSTTTKTQTQTVYGYGGPGPGGHGGGFGHGAPGGPGERHRHVFGPDLAATAKSLGVTEAQLKSALEAARPGKSDRDEVKGARIDAAAAAIAKELGESTADVKAVLESLRPTPGERPDPSERPKRLKGAPGHVPGAPGGPRVLKTIDTELVTALAKKFDISEAEAKAAVESVRKTAAAEHAKRQSALYASIAKSLGKTPAEVKKAFEANRPPLPTKPGAPAPTTP